MDASDHQTYGISSDVLKFVEKTRSQGKKVVIIVFDTPYSLQLFKKDQAVIVAYEKDVDAYQAAADVFIGKIQAMGILPVADRRSND